MSSLFKSKSNLTKQERQILCNLKQKKVEIMLKPADENLGIVILSTDDYLHLCTQQLADASTYRQCTGYPKETISTKTKETVSRFTSHVKSIHKQLYDFLTPHPSKTQTPTFYGIPKINKTFTSLPPLRPIVSHCNSPLSPSAHFIDHILQPIARSYPDYLHNSTSLVHLLSRLHLPDNSILVAVDVESLYPSIPQDECLNIIYNEMYRKTDLLISDPNLIIRLLHINVNFNYFEFVTLFFQQVKGTAMGAAFSPTVANIFLSITLQNFLQTQPLKPFLLKRYIDDIIIIWPYGQSSLKEFLTHLNSFHPSLRFISTSSDTSMDFLDLTIFKGPTFEYTSLLDIKTFQKPKNLYQYLHFSSNHPRAVFKSVITGECIRYARTNTIPANFHATVELFKQRLRRRQYPTILINKAVNSIKYKDRQKFLQQSTSSHRPIKKTIFKCLPPPQFTALIRIILQNYNTVQQYAPLSRFIPLKHRTLKQELIRAKISPTDAQFIDIITVLGPMIQPEHVSAGVLPPLTRNPIATTFCQNSRCITCKHLDCNNYLKSTTTGFCYPIRHRFSCTSSNIIYLITCKKCKKQYVGRTTNQLNHRLNPHHTSIINNKTMYLYIHFNFPDHSFEHLSVQAIDQASSWQELKRLEHHWIHTLQTQAPKGLNLTA